MRERPAANPRDQREQQFGVQLHNESGVRGGAFQRRSASARFARGSCTEKKRYSSHESSTPTAARTRKAEVALDQVQFLEQVGQPEPDDPRVEAHADAAERFRPNPLDQRRADRHADGDARHDVRHQARLSTLYNPAHA